ncbi:hypothetical protein [Streptomyces sp. NPDC085596]|uniref:hypothetical protein n=1 Tax=Streptomyces sp. NPDC085596 TaxID=3365731 RepID=UPI0037D15A1B
MALGSPDWIRDDLELGGAPAASSDTDVVVRVQAQILRVAVDDPRGYARAADVVLRAEE